MRWLPASHTAQKRPTMGGQPFQIDDLDTAFGQKMQQSRLGRSSVSIQQDQTVRQRIDIHSVVNQLTIGLISAFDRIRAPTNLLQNGRERT